MAGLLQEMHELQKQPTTTETQAQLDKYNLQALRAVARELRRHQIEFRLVDPAKDAKRELQADQRARAELLRDLEQQSLEEKDSSNKEFLEQMMRQARTEIAQLDRKIEAGGRSPIDPLQDVVAQLRSQPYLVIVSSKTNPAALQSLMRVYGAQLIVSAYYKSMFPNSRGGVYGNEAPKFFLPLEDFFAPTYQISGTILHEARHLSLQERKSRRILTSYAVDAIALNGHKLPRSRAGIYDEVFSFEEISTWGRDLTYLSSKKLGNFRKRIFAYGKVYEAPIADQMKLRTALRLKGFAEQGLALSQLARETIQFEPETLQFRIVEPLPESLEQKGYSSVTIPLKQDGERVAELRVALVNLTTQNQNQKIEILTEYLYEVEIAAIRERVRADRVLEGRDAKDETEWLAIGQ